MKKMKDFASGALFLMSAAALLAGFPSCEPQTQPRTAPEDPDPVIDPPTPPGPGSEPEETVIYYDNLDKEKSAPNGNYFNTWTACRDMEGTGISDVAYDGFYTSVRSDFESRNYPGASGMNGVYYSKDGGQAYIQVKNISLPSDVRTYKLSVGLHNPDLGNTVISGQTFSIGIADEESVSAEYRELPFEVTRYAKWSYATAVFEITSAETEHISIQIKSLVAKGRSDDLRLVTTTETPEHGFGFIHREDPVPEAKDYIERPQTVKASADYKYVDHRGTTYRTKQEVRNYEACYDIRRHNPMWVAFPCHGIYDEGNKVRPAGADPWRPDPAFKDGEQSIIYADDWDSWPNNTYRYWGGVSDGTFTKRGHLLGSADRGAGNSKVLLDLNVQTFYPTNIAPELYLNDTGGDNYDATHWGLVERHRQDYWVCSDTLYVVIGCAYEHENWKVDDNVSGKKKFDGSKPCIMPTARYLVALRTKSGNTRKPIYECSSDKLMAIGFWFPQRFDQTTLSTLPPLADYIYSVSEIEEKIGGEFSFFPLAPEGVKDSYSIGDWPGLADIAR